MIIWDPTPMINQKIERLKRWYKIENLEKNGNGGEGQAWELREVEKQVRKRTPQTYVFPSER